ncbi:MAG: FixH family protein [Flavobacteriaceae bacterium]|nr:FixH family protein [Flavobacteriaceae bacterium]
MKFKINSNVVIPAMIIIAITLFMGYILQFVYKAMAMPEYNHQLVTTNYYQKELKYQSEIDKEKRAKQLKQDVIVTKNEEGLLIIFPDEFESKKITGIVELLRLSDEKADITLPVIVENHRLLIKDEKLIKGQYQITIDWEVNGQGYMLKKEIMY